MENKTITRKDYTTWGESYQLSLPLNYEIRIPKDDPVRLLRHFIEGMDLSELYRTYSEVAYVSTKLKIEQNKEGCP